VSASDGSAGRTAQALGRLSRTARVLTGRPLGEESLRAFARYLDLLVAWNRAQRLTAFDSPEAMVRGLFEDSLLFLPMLPPAPLALLDIGAGAGVPGLPLRLVEPRIALTLIESRRKRVSFLRTVLRELRLGDVTVLEGRAETIIRERQDLAGSFDAVLCRGVGSLEALLPTARSYLRRGGTFIASGPPIGQAVRTPGAARLQVQDYPGLGTSRAFLIERFE
jgi:16S rRNA (guanine527-N7)-methyltransferase